VRKRDTPRKKISPIPEEKKLEIEKERRILRCPVPI
jgi:hypothetical protein